MPAKEPVLARNQVPTKAKADDEGLIRKANEAIAIKPLSGRLTFLSRKVFNTLLYHAQKQREKQKYRVPLSDLVAGADFDSHDVALLKDHLRRMKRTEVEWNDPGNEWRSGWLIGEVGLVREGRKLYVEWEYTSSVRGYLLDPGRYTGFALRWQAILRSHAGLALFEICSRYATNPTAVTNKAPPDWWYPRLTGNPGGALEPHFYRYFKRDVIRPAVNEINSLTDLEIELLEHTRGRKVVEIQFAVRRQAQASLELPEPPVIDGALLERVIRLGMTPAEAEEIYTSHDEAFLRATLDLVEQRRANKALAPLESAAAFFKSALRQRYALGRRPAKPTVPAGAAKRPEHDPAASMEAARAALANKRRGDARRYFAELGDAEKNDLLAEFEASLRLNAGTRHLAGKLRNDGLKSKLIENQLMSWLVSKLWGEATDAEVLEHVLANPLAVTA